MERPTWSNYGTHETAARPWLWHGVELAVAPCLGPSGTRLFDHSRNGRHGTLTSMDPPTDWVVDRGQYCLDFDNTDDFVEFGTWNIPINNGTMSAWVYVRDTVDAGRILDSRYDLGMWMGVSGSGASMGGGFLTAGSPYGSFGTIVANAWNHVAIKRTGTTNRTYINGSSASSSDYTGSSGATTTLVNLRIGKDYANNANSFFDGRIDDVRIYSRAISDAEIRELAEFRGAAYEPRSTRRYFYQTDASIPVTGTVAVTLDNITAVGSGTGGTGGGTGLTASQPLAFNLSDSLVIGG